MEFVSRAGQKLEHALVHFSMDVSNLVCADLGSNVGGFVDCLLQRGASKVYSIDTGYGVLAWTLRKDPRVVVMERTNAMHVVLPEQVSFVSIDVAWTRQKHILPAARKLLLAGASVITLIKPHYEATPAELRKGVLPEENLPGVLEHVKADITSAEFELLGIVQSPIKGAKGNVEYLGWLKSA